MVQLAVLSAADERDLDAAAQRLGDLLAERPDLPLGDITASLAARPAGPCRMAVLAPHAGLLAEALLSDTAPAPATVVRGRVGAVTPSVVLMFPGVGDHYTGMASGLYHDQPVFRSAFDECAGCMAAVLGTDLHRFLLPDPTDDRAEPAGGPAWSGRVRLAELMAPAPVTEIDRAEVAQPLVFAVGWALAVLLAHFGVRPAATLGYSVGEYVAATLAGVFTPTAAAELVAERARLAGGTAPGAMAAVLLGAAELAPVLADCAAPGLVVAAHDGPHLSVVSGPVPAVQALTARLTADGVAVSRLPVERAFHSPAMEPVVAALADRVGTAAPRAPSVPMLSNVTGDWLATDQATNPAYWAGQLSRPVRFADNLDRAWRLPAPLLLEVGPGGALSTLAGQHPARPAGGLAVPTLAGRHRAGSDRAALLTGLATAWVHGVPVDLPAVLR